MLNVRKKIVVMNVKILIDQVARYEVKEWVQRSKSKLRAQSARVLHSHEILEEPADLSANTCNLVWEGELRSRNFKIWVGECEASNDAAARKWLGKGAENFWRLAVQSEQS